MNRTLASFALMKLCSWLNWKYNPKSRWRTGNPTMIQMRMSIYHYCRIYKTEIRPLQTFRLSIRAFLSVSTWEYHITFIFFIFILWNDQCFFSHLLWYLWLFWIFYPPSPSNLNLYFMTKWFPHKNFLWFPKWWKCIWEASSNYVWNDRSEFPGCTLCWHRLSVWKENNKTFLYCPVCMKKYKSPLE